MDVYAYCPFMDSIKGDVLDVFINQVQQ